MGAQECFDQNNKKFSLDSKAILHNQREHLQARLASTKVTLDGRKGQAMDKPRSHQQMSHEQISQK